MSRFTRENGGQFIVDQNGNRATVAHWGTVEGAMSSLESLADCYNCTDCLDCTDCSHCIECTDCAGCARMVNATGADNRHGEEAGMIYAWLVAAFGVGLVIAALAVKALI